ncbi:hypothetical protein Cva_01620 [Caedimonas varicaedens]|uniref:Uncharacterized protein n=1 Tax=Caedimonas varicaedens TaxID=1629334 RepID=A0A0K8MEL8_9PROT|nr:hypothetical protein Cva_01620 [Caedimonas varicaedens]
MNQESTALAVMADLPDASVDYINATTSAYSSKIGQSNAYQAVAQAASQAIQDARASLQNTEMMVEAVEAVMSKKLAKYVETGDIPNAELLLTLMEKYSGANGPLALKNKFLGDVSATASTIAGEFPSGA